MTIAALTIAGSDSGGGAGIQADLKTFSALGVYGTSAITALTAQNTCGVQGIHEIPASFVAQQIKSVLSDIATSAIKIGMLSNTATVVAVADALAEFQGPIILDPVMVATSGDRLIAPDAIEAVKSRLFPLATLVTPNLLEAAALLEDAPTETDEDIQRQGERLLRQGAKAVLIKGGHGIGSMSVDVLINPHGIRSFTAWRIMTRNTHGTGCTLSAAIAAEMAKGLGLDAAITQAKAYVSAALEAADTLKIGHGHGPVHHFHPWWTR